MPSEITTVQIKQFDITQLSLKSSDITTVRIQTGDVTVLTNTPATINAANLSLSNDLPINIARAASAGASSSVSRADHTHSVADTLLDGGNY